MKEITTTITRRGQVTVPVQVQRLLGVKPRDKVTFAIEHKTVHLVPVTFTLESVYGSVASLGKSASFKELSRKIKDAKAEEFFGKRRGRS